uniref:Uncharacterized protein n=1 Tax=Anopheles darlingi TaxID=43151 RepID=A0A2M4DJW0_ANODA
MTTTPSRERGQTVLLLLLSVCACAKILLLLLCNARSSSRTKRKRRKPGTRKSFSNLSSLLSTTPFHNIFVCWLCLYGVCVVDELMRKIVK